MSLSEDVSWYSICWIPFYV